MKKGNKTLWIIIAVIAILIIAFAIFQYQSGQRDAQNQEQQTGGAGSAEIGGNNLESDEDVFNEIDSTLNYLE